VIAYDIPLELITTNGNGIIKIDNGELHITNNKICIPSTFKLPFRIDITLKANSSNFKLEVGKGSIRFAGDIQKSGGGILRADILTGKAEPVKYEYGNELPLDEFIDLSVMYGSKATWVELNGMKCYLNSTAPYIQLLGQNELSEELVGGFNIALGCGTKRTLVVKSFAITEYENDEPELTNDELHLSTLSSFEWYIKSLPPEIQMTALSLDTLIMRELKTTLKFNRSIDKYGYVTYKTTYGLQYQVRGFGKNRKQTINWVQSKNKPDYTNEIFNNLFETSPEFAEALFNKLKQCNPHKRECNKRTSIDLNGNLKHVCKSKIPFNMTPSGFDDIKKVILAASEILYK